MGPVALAWVAASIILVIFLMFSWKMLGSFGRAWIATLLVGKMIAGIFYVAGVDRPVIALVFRNGYIINITAAELMFLMFLLTLLVTIMIVVYGELLPQELRRALTVEEVNNNE